MNNNYTHGIIASVWIILTFLLGSRNFPGVYIYLFTTYLLVTVWFIIAWKRHAPLNITVKIIGMIGMIFCFFLLRGNLYDLFYSVLNPDENASLYLIIASLLSNEFIVIFISALIISPLLISIFNKRFIEMSIVIAISTFFYLFGLDFSSIRATTLTIGIISSRLLGVILATYLSSVILHRIIKTEPSNKPMD